MVDESNRFEDSALQIGQGAEFAQAIEECHEGCFHLLGYSTSGPCYFSCGRNCGHVEKECGVSGIDVSAITATDRRPVCTETKVA